MRSSSSQYTQRSTAFRTCISLTLALVAIAVARSSAAAAQDSPAAAAFEKLRPSLAIVTSEDDKNRARGTGFCIASDDRHSYFLTNAHVIIGDTIYLQLQDGGIYPGRLVRLGQKPIDLAVIEITRANVPALTLSSALPKPGTPIGVAGFPSIHLESDHEPSVHLGAVNSVSEENGLYIEHDALTDHGNSGGPLFDQQTGVVYGVNTFGIQSKTDKNIQNFFAIAITGAFGFLGNAHVAYSTDAGSPQSSSASSALLPDTPGAYRIGYFASTASSAGAAPIKVRVDAYITQQIQSFTNGTVIPLLMTSFSPAVLRQYCQEQQLNAVFIALYDWHAKGTGGNKAHYDSNVKFAVGDCYVDPVYAADGKFELDATFDNSAQTYYDVATSAADQAFSLIRDQIAKDPTVTVNLLRYGIPLGTGQKTTGISLTPGQQGAVVARVSSYGSAARAGIQRLDVISSINGHPLGGLQQPDIDTLMAQIERAGGDYAAEVISADGHHTVIHFRSQDIRSYLRQMNPK